MNRGLEARAGASATARAAAWAKRLPAPTTNVSKLYLGDRVRPSIVRGGVYSRGAAVGATGGGASEMAKVIVRSRPTMERSAPRIRSRYRDSTHSLAKRGRRR